MTISTKLQFCLVILSLSNPLSVSKVQQVITHDKVVEVDSNWSDNDIYYNSQDNTVVLQSHAVTNWGKWGDLVQCSNERFYVTGFQLKVETRQIGADNTAVNGISLSCGTSEEQEIERIMSASGTRGTNRTKYFCLEGPVLGFQLKVQRPQKMRIDDAATVNIKMICENGKVFEGYDEQEDYYADTVWSEPMMCPESTAVCGIQTQVEPTRWLGDNTAVNNIRIKCCSLRDQNEQVQTADPIVATSTVAPAYKLTIFESQQGTGVNETLEMSDDDKCSNLPLHWRKAVGSFVKETRCLRLWQDYDCSGSTRCYCDNNFLSLNESYTMNMNSSWYQQLSSVGPCRMGDDNNSKGKHAEALLFSEIGFEGDTTEIVLGPGECVTFYRGDLWRDHVVGVIANLGCVKLYDGEECTGEHISIDSAVRFVGKKWVNRTVAVSNCLNE